MIGDNQQYGRCSSPFKVTIVCEIIFVTTTEGTITTGTLLLQAGCRPLRRPSRASASPDGEPSQDDAAAAAAAAGRLEPSAPLVNLVANR